MIYVFDGSQIGFRLHRELQNAFGPNNVKASGGADRGDHGDLFVGAIDGCQIRQLVQWEQSVLGRGMGFMPIHIHGGEAIIGPVCRPDRPGCFECWAQRYFGSRKSARQFAERLSDSASGPRCDPALTPLSVYIVSLISAKCVADHVRTSRVEGRLGWPVLYFDLETMTGREWQVRPDSACPRCARLPEDKPQLAKPDIRDRLKPSKAVDRLRPLRNLTSVVESYTGYRSNIVSQEYINWNFEIGAVVSVAVTLSENRRPEPCSGFCANYQDARTIAILEGLERYSGVRPRGIRTAVRGSLASLGEVAVDPRLFGLHSPEEYVRYPDLLTAFSKEMELDFVWAYSFGGARNVLLPKQLAYYSLASQNERSFVIEGSIGCVLGSAFEECILHGIFEVVERDAFLLTWYAQIQPPSFDVLKCTDPEVRYRYRHLRKEGFDVFAFDITTDYGIPAVWILARRRVPAMPFAFCCGAAHIRPEQAVKKALRELTAACCRYSIEVQSAEIRGDILAMADDPTRVRTMEDHARFYCAPQSGRYLEFLMNSPRRTCLQTMEEGARNIWSKNLTVELNGSIERILKTGGDVISAKQTPPELSEHGLHAYKTLVSGAIPMTWGRHRRLENLPRLDAALLAQQPCNGSPISPNALPHPYP